MPYKKITSVKQLSKLNKGDLVLKFPINGESALNFKGVNESNISPRIISQNSTEKQVVTISHPIAKPDVYLAIGIEAALYKPVRKTYQDIIDESVWWIKVRR